MVTGTVVALAHRPGALGAGPLAVVQAHTGALAGGRSGRVGGRPPPGAGPGAVCLPGLFDGGRSLYVQRHARASVGPGLGTGASTPALARRRWCGAAGSIGDTQCLASTLLARYRSIIRTRTDCPSGKFYGPQYPGHGFGSPKPTPRGDPVLY